MNFRSNALTVAAVAAFGIIGSLFAADASYTQEPFTAVASASAADVALADAAAGVTFKIVPSDVMAPMLAAGPLTGDGSN